MVDSPVPLAEGRDIGESLVASWVVMCVRGPLIRHGRPLLIFIAFLGCSLFRFGQFQLLAVHQERLVMERLLVWKTDRY